MIIFNIQNRFDFGYFFLNIAGFYQYLNMKFI